MIFPMPKETGELFDGICQKLVDEGKAERLPDEFVRCIKDGSRDGRKVYQKVYLIKFKRDDVFERSKYKVRFFYHTISAKTREYSKDVDRCEINICDEALKLVVARLLVLAENWPLAVMLKDLITDKGIDAMKLKEFIEIYLEQQGKPKSDIGIIIE